MRYIVRAIGVIDPTSAAEDVVEIANNLHEARRCLRELVTRYSPNPSVEESLTVARQLKDWTGTEYLSLWAQAVEYTADEAANHPADPLHRARIHRAELEAVEEERDRIVMQCAEDHYTTREIADAFGKSQDWVVKRIQKLTPWFEAEIAKETATIEEQKRANAIAMPRPPSSRKKDRAARRRDQREGDTLWRRIHGAD